MEMNEGANVHQHTSRSKWRLTGSSVHGVSKELKSRPFSTEDARGHRTAVETNSETKVGGTRSKRKLQLFRKLAESV